MCVHRRGGREASTPSAIIALRSVPSVVLLATVLLLFSSAVSAQTVRVGFYENAPKLFTDDSGRVAGFFPEIIEAIAAEEGWTIEYVPGTWAENLERLNAGDIDLMPDVGYSEARASIYGFSGEPLFINWGVIYRRPGAGIESIPDLIGKRIAVMAGSIHTDGEQGIRAILSQFDVESTFIEYPDYAAVFEALGAGEAEAGAVNRLFGSLNASSYGVEATPIIFNPRELRFAYPLGSQFGELLAERIDGHVRSMKADPDSVYYESLAAHLAGSVETGVIGVPRWLYWIFGLAGAAIGVALFVTFHARRRQRRLGTELAGSEDRYRTFFEASIQGLCVYRIDPPLPTDLSVEEQIDWVLDHTTIVEANEEAARVYRVPLEKLRGLPIRESWGSEETARATVRGWIEGGYRFDATETLEELVDGSQAWMLNLGVSTIVDGHVSEYVSTFIDITERKNAELRLRESEDRLKDAQSIGRIGHWVLDLDRDLLVWSDEVYRIFGEDPLTFLPSYEAFLERVHPEDRDAVSAAWGAAVSGNPYEIEHRILVDGEIKWVRERARMESAEEGRPRRGIGIVTDITEQKLAEEERENLLQQMGERVKELSCLYGSTELVARAEDLEDVFRGVVGMIPPAWQYPAIARSRIVFDGREYLSESFSGGDWIQARDIEVNGEVRGSVAVHYLEERPNEFEGPFLREERDLLDALARTLGEAVERRQAEKGLRQYEFIVNSSQDLMTLIGSDQRYVAVSDSFCACHEKDRNEIVGRTVSEIWGEAAFREGIRAPLFACLAGEKAQFNGWMDVPSEGRRYYDVRYTPFQPNGDEASYAVVVSRDITERILALEELRRHQERLEYSVEQRTAELRTAVDAANAAMFRHDLATDHVVLDDRWYEMTGMSREEFPDTQAAWERCLHPEDRDRVTAEIDRQLASDATGMQIEYRLLRPDGGVRYIESRSIILRDDEGRATGTVGLNIDVTHRVEAEEELREREAFLRTTLDNLAAHFWATDRDLRFTVQNELSRMAMGDVVGKRLEDLDIPNDLGEMWMRDNERVLAGETVEQEFTFPIGKEERDFVARISPILLGGEVVGTIGTSIDITERRRMEEALREREAYLRTLMDNMPIDFFALDREMRYTMQSKLSRSVIGDAIGRSVADSDAPEELKTQWVEEHREVLGGETIHREYRIPVDGDEHTFMTTVAPVQVGDEVVGSIGTSMDITERERMEAELRRARDELEQRVQERTKDLRESEERFRTLFERAPDAFYINDLEGTFLDGNRAAEELVGQPKETLVGKNFLDVGLLSPEDRRNAKDLLSKNVRGEPTGPDEIRLQRADGSEVPVEIRTYPVSLAGQAVVLSIARDVTERHRIMEALRESKELAEGMIDVANAVIVELDAEARIVRFNRYAETLTGYRRREVLKRDWFEVFIPVRDRSEIPEVFREVLQRMPEASSHTNVILCKDGSERTIEWGNTTLSDREGVSRGVLSIGIDITERVKALRDLRASEQQLLDVLEGTIAAFARTVEARDPYTAGHQEHVASLATAIARKLGLSADDVEATRVAGLLHDIGKISIPAEILAKPTKLTPVEWDMIKLHPEHAYRILEGIRFPWPIAEIVLQHHERMDGSGYPNGVTGDTMHTPAKILCVADTVEAMASHRPYRAALGLDAALDVIRGGRGTVYDPDVADACVELFDKDGFTFDSAD